uniref:Uncharacterized protein n=1 Tax=Anguilla anguilla TaxID=7936 RepID=A0A0E9XQI7_ANGAN
MTCPPTERTTFTGLDEGAVSAGRGSQSTWSQRMTSVHFGTLKPSTTPLWRKCP